MALPEIAPYPMPGADDLPGNRAGWRPDPRRAVLLVHDMQNYFVDAYDRRRAPIPDLIHNIGLLRDTGVPVVYSAQPGGQTPAQRRLLRDFWGGGLDDDPHQEAIVDPLRPRSDDTRLTKWRYSAFVRTPLEEMLRGWGRDQLIVCGIYAHIGCLMTACDAFMRDIETFLAADAMADFTLAHHRQALTYAAERCAVTTTTQALVEELAQVDVA